MKDRILNTLLLLTVALALGISIKKTPDGVPVQSNAETVLTSVDPVAAYRERREAQRKREEEALLALLNAEACDAALRKQAQETLLDIQRRAETERTAEALAIGRGYGDAVCTLAGETLLFVLRDPITQESAARLTALAAEATGIAAENIRVSADPKPS